jgi:mannan endo-1,4-beta-mannosidase
VARPRVTPPPRPPGCLGVFEPGVPASYAPVSMFAAQTGATLSLASYYSGWLDPFQPVFAAQALAQGVTVLVQMDPTGIPLAAIAAGQYDAYLRTFALTVAAFGHPVILSFGHEMNGNWYDWGWQHTPAPVFVAAWQHIVTLFRAAGAANVTWLWTINVTGDSKVTRAAAWWPGSAYVSWVGIDGYFLAGDQTFGSLFGPTIHAVRQLTADPVLIAETAASPEAGKPAKIAALFAGIRTWGLLGFVWFDTVTNKDWRISTHPPAITAFSEGAAAYRQSTGPCPA